MAKNPGASGRPLMTQKEYAAHRGCSKQYVNQLVKQGRITLIDGKIDPVAADAALQAGRDPARDEGFRTDKLFAPPERLSSDADDAVHPGAPYAKARTVREHFRALRERLEYEHLAAKLVVVREVEDAGYEAGLAVREDLENAASRIGEAIATEFQVDERRATEIAAAEIRATLEELRLRFTDDRWRIAKGLSSDQS